MAVGPDGGKGKTERLRDARALNSRADAVRDELFCAHEFFDPRDLVQVKYELVRRVQVDGLAVARVTSRFGFSRPSYYEAAAALASEGVTGLLPAKPGPRHPHKLTDEVIAFAMAARDSDPSLRAADLAELIAARFGVVVHPRSVERVLARLPHE